MQADTFAESSGIEPILPKPGEHFLDMGRNTEGAWEVLEDDPEEILGDGGMIELA